MKCEECKFCKYDNSIKEFVCSIEPDLPVVARDAKNNCKKAIAIVKDGEKERRQQHGFITERKMHGEC